MASLEAPAHVPVEKRWFGHPRGLSVLFFTEMWERFSYYGMRALLVIYLATPPDGVSPPGPGLGFSVGEASAIYASYVSLVYVFPLAGGWIADRLWGARRSVLWGGIVIACGHYFMAVPVDATFWIGLLLIAFGTGLLKPNISAMVGQLYGAADTRRDAGFSIFYMGINIGSFVAPLVTGYLAQSYNWHFGFAAAGVGMTFAVIWYLAGQKHLGDAGLRPGRPADRRTKRGALIVVAAIVVAVVIVGVVDVVVWNGSITALTTVLTVVILAMPIVYFVPLLRSKRQTPVERSRVKAFCFLFVGAIFFWMIFDQAGSTLSLFAQYNTNRSVFGWEFPAAWFQSVNPLFIIIFAPVFAALWVKLADRAPTTPVKFAIALVGIGISFTVMIIPGMAADKNQLSPIWWLLGIYLMQTWAELLLSPIGLSATTKLAPEGMNGQLLALWFLAVAVGDSIGGQLINLFEEKGVAFNFAIFGIAAIAVGVFLALFSRKIHRLMAGIH